jgi:hypothetical protein
MNFLLWFASHGDLNLAMHALPVFFSVTPNNFLITRNMMRMIPHHDPSPAPSDGNGDRILIKRSQPSTGRINTVLEGQPVLAKSI